MVRPRKVNKVPMTTVAVSENLVKLLNLSRPANRSIGDFLNEVFQQWKEFKEVVYNWKDEVPVMQDLIKSQERRIIELEEIIEANNKTLDERLEIKQ
jgi:hypothetical protein